MGDDYDYTKWTWRTTTSTFATYSYMYEEALANWQRYNSTSYQLLDASTEKINDFLEEFEVKQ